MTEPLLPRASRSQANPINLNYVNREVRVLTLTEHELDGLASSNAPLYLTFLGISFGAFVSLACTLYSVSIIDPVSHATFVAMTWLTLAASVLFGVLAARSFLITHKKLAELKGSPGPR